MRLDVVLVDKDLFSHVITLLIAGGLSLCIGCSPVCQSIRPHIASPLPVHQIQMHSSFPPLSKEEKKEDWGRELQIGEAFAREGDFYRAITAFRRAEILAPESGSRKLQITYDIVLSYFLGGKYQEAINVFEGSDLSCVGANFPAFDNLLLILYEAYLKVEQEEKATCVLEIINKCSPECGEDLKLYESFQKGDIQEVKVQMETHRNGYVMQRDFAFYDQFSKSVTKAKLLNALLPGMGYYYVGQKKSAMTSFIINALFTAAATQFFLKGYPAAGAITASLEAGWYFGGINGAGIEAQEFNTRLFEGVGRKILTDHYCFPVLMFESSF